jgi:hypothetical protein
VVKSDVVAKLLRVALDPSASEGEAKNAANRMVERARRDGVRYEDLSRHYGGDPAELLRLREELENANRRIDNLLAARTVDPGLPKQKYPRGTMPFGKYAGTPFGEVARRDPEYLEWVLANCDLKPWLRKTIAEAMGSY